MICISNTLQRTVENSLSARNKLEDIIKKFKNKEEKSIKFFNSEIESSLTNSKINDARETTSGFYILTEYTSESSIDKIEDIVSNQLKTIKVTNNSFNEIASENNIESTIAHVYEMKEYIKGSANNFIGSRFSMSRIQTGAILFLYMVSESFQDEENFGRESITTTAIYYKLVSSIVDVKHQQDLDLYKVYKQEYIILKKKQAELMHKLSEGKISFDEWQKLDKLFSKVVNKAKAQLESINVS